MKTFLEQAREIQDEIIANRRVIHSYAEWGFDLPQTYAYVTEQLKSYGYQPEKVGKMGVVCTAGRPGPTILLRADMDALPMAEETGASYAAANGNCHSCGHDCHTAMLLGAAKILMENKDAVKGKVKLFFQSAEETCHGAEYYVEQGVLDGVDAIMGQHIWGKLDDRYINFEPGRRMASCDNFTITVDGVAAHATQPELGADALIGAASILMNLQTFVSRNNSPLNPLVVTVGEMHAGTRFNIIANHAEMYGTVRTFEPEFRMSIEAQIKRIVENTAAALGLKAELKYEYYPSAVINDDQLLNEVAQKAVEKLYGAEVLHELPMAMGSSFVASGP